MHVGLSQVYRRKKTPAQGRSLERGRGVVSKTVGARCLGCPPHAAATAYPAMARGRGGGRGRDSGGGREEGGGRREEGKPPEHPTVLGGPNPTIDQGAWTGVFLVGKKVRSTDLFYSVLLHPTASRPRPPHTQDAMRTFTYQSQSAAIQRHWGGYMARMAAREGGGGGG